MSNADAAPPAMLPMRRPYAPPRPWDAAWVTFQKRLREGMREWKRLCTDHGGES